MARFRLRYGTTDLEVPLGDFVIGRSSSCNLALDDGLVSRRHARLRVTEGGATVEDLGSRNGVQVNGKPISGAHAVKHLDRITIGNQELVLLEKSQHSAAQTLQIERCWSCGGLNEPGAKSCASCGAKLGGDHPTMAGGKPTARFAALSVAAGEDEATTSSSSFTLIAPIAEKALALQRYDEAARLLAPSLKRLLELARRGKTVPPETFERGTHMGQRLAEGPDASRWLTWSIELHDATGTLMSAETIDRLHELVRKARYADPKPLRAYLAALRDKKLSPAQRFTMRRLESLERVISA